MSNESGTQLQSIDRAMLTPLVRQAIDSQTVKVTDWDLQQIHGGFAGGNPGSSVIYRVTGCGSTLGDAVEWSLILKVLSPQSDRDQPSDYHYWRREVHAFESGLLDDLPGGLAAPRCFGVIERSGGECWIWMEDVADDIGFEEDIGSEWPVEHYSTVARHLGQFNGAYLTGERPIPIYPWLRRRSYLRDLAARVAARRAGILTQLHNSLDHPLVRRAYPPDVVDLLSRKWAEDWELQNSILLDALDRLAATLCHNDAFRRNLFARHAPDRSLQTVAIDWAFVGIGWIGWEINYLVSHPLTMITMGRDEARERDLIAFEGYLDGLRDAGWQGDTRQVRFGQIAPQAIFHVNVFVRPWYFLNEAQYVWREAALGCSIEEMADFICENIRYHLYSYWEEEAWQLLDELW